MKRRRAASWREAYTNDYRVMFCPEPAVWREIYLRQLDGLEGNAAEEIRAYYETAVGENHILSILGHELAHHSEWFPDDFEDERESGIWFEEGMVEYIWRSPPRRSSRRSPPGSGRRTGSPEA